MRSRYVPAEAEEQVRQDATQGRDLALRVYTSRLLGADPTLVLHGGGNTSVKTTAPDLFGREVAVLHVKGSGSDLAQVQPQDLPAVRLAPLRELRALEQLSDQQMVAELRCALLDPDAAQPSVETLLHAFLPHKYVDHTHADAILALTDQPDPARHVRAALGELVVVLPWVMPGFPLAKQVAAAVERQPEAIGVVLCQHGLFTFGPDAQTSYERTIELVARAEQYLRRQLGGAPPMLLSMPAPLPIEERAAVWRTALPLLRGALAQRDVAGEVTQRVVADLRMDEAAASFTAHPDAARLCATGPVTPDHVIRTKGPYLLLRREQALDAGRVHREISTYCDAYRAYYDAHARSRAGGVELPPEPVIVAIEGAGFAAFRSERKAARVAADIASTTLRVKATADALERYCALPDAAVAEMEYWPLELRKLGKRKPALLAGQVAMVTGAAGAIGCGIVTALLQAGACVFATDRDEARLQRAATRWHAWRERVQLGVGDLCVRRELERLVGECVLAFGGLDCLVPNAGLARTGNLLDLDPQQFAQTMEVNAHATFQLLQTAGAVLRQQGTGGSVVLQASKNVFAPGAGFGAYSASKAAALQLARIAALEFAAFGVRVNAINADAVFGDATVSSQLWEQVGPARMAARGLDAAGLREHYRARSLLQVPVLPEHVGAAVVFFASMQTPTTGAVLPVDGGLPEAFPR